MTEQVYVNVMNLARIRFALDTISHVSVESREDNAKLRAILKGLQEFQRDLESVVLDAAEPPRDDPQAAPTPAPPR